MVTNLKLQNKLTIIQKNYLIICMIEKGKGRANTQTGLKFERKIDILPFYPE